MSDEMAHVRPLVPGADPQRTPLHHRLTTRGSTGVLVIEADPEVRAALGRWLRQDGYTVWLAANEREALEVHRQYQDVISSVVVNLRLWRLPPAR